MSNASYRYSYALFSLAKEEDKLDEIFEDFSAFIKAYEEDSNIKKVFSMLSKGEKKDIVTKALSLGELYDDTIKGIIKLNKVPIVAPYTFDEFKYDDLSINEHLKQRNDSLL